MEQLLSGIPDARPMNPAERERKKGEENDKDDGSFKNTKSRHESTSEQMERGSYPSAKREKKCLIPDFNWVLITVIRASCERARRDISIDD